MNILLEKDKSTPIDIHLAISAMRALYTELLFTVADNRDIGKHSTEYVDTEGEFARIGKKMCRPLVPILSTLVIAVTALSTIDCMAEEAPSTVVGVTTTFDIPEMDVPPLQKWVTDPIFGTPLKRISEAVSTSEGGVVVPMYSKTQPWNADGSLMLVYQTGKGHQLRDGKTHEVIRNLVWEYEDNVYVPTDIENIWWHPTDVDILIYPCVDKVTKIPRIVRYRVSTGKIETICKFPEYVNNKNFGTMGEGNMSNDGRWIVLRAAPPPERIREYFVYDLLEKKKYPPVQLPYKYVDWVSISPLGNYVVVNAAGEGLYVYNRNMELLYSTFSSDGKGEHADMGIDAEGNEVLVTFTFKPIKERLYMMRLSDGVKTTLVGTIDSYDQVYWTGTHVSCRNTRLPGWAYISTVTGKGVGKALHKEVYRVKLDDTHYIERLAHHRSDNTTGAGYWAEPHLVVNQDGTQFMFASNWSKGNKIATYVGTCEQPKGVVSSTAKKEIDKIENSPAYVNQKKAAELFLQIRNSYKEAGKTQTVTSLKKLIADYPDTPAAERAKIALKNIEM